MVDVLRGLALHSTALSCPVRFCKLRRGVIEVWHGVAEWGPVRLGQAGLGRLRSFFAWRGSVGWRFVLRGMVSSWPGEVLFGAVGFIGVLHSKVRSHCGMAWNVKALHGMAKFGPAKYCVVMHAKALLLHGGFWLGGAVQSEVHYAKLSLRRGIVRHGTVGSGFARLRAAGQALALLCYGGVRLGGARFSRVRRYFGDVLLGHVRWSPVLQGRVRLGVHGYGGVTT